MRLSEDFAEEGEDALAAEMVAAAMMSVRVIMVMCGMSAS